MSNPYLTKAESIKEERPETALVLPKRLLTMSTRKRSLMKMLNTLLSQGACEAGERKSKAANNKPLRMQHKIPPAYDLRSLRIMSYPVIAIAESGVSAFSQDLVKTIGDVLCLSACSRNSSVLLKTDLTLTMRTEETCKLVLKV